jgi:two-component system nitrate/nitrite response regulator NarL
MSPTIKVAILEDHQSIIDGYLYRLGESEEIEVVGTAAFGEDLDPLLQSRPVDVLIMDINVPARPDTTSPFPALFVTRRIIQEYPDINILVISILTQQTLIQALVEIGISGYIFKQDGDSIRQLSNVVTVIANNGIYFSQEAYDKLRLERSSYVSATLTARQLEALSLCAAYPDCSTADIAVKLKVANSTLRNLLSSAYLRLNVGTRSAAIIRLQQLGLIAPNPTEAEKPPRF